MTMMMPCCSDPPTICDRHDNILMSFACLDAWLETIFIRFGALSNPGVIYIIVDYPCPVLIRTLSSSAKPTWNVNALGDISQSAVRLLAHTPANRAQ